MYRKYCCVPDNRPRLRCARPAVFGSRLCSASRRHPGQKSPPIAPRMTRLCHKRARPPERLAGAEIGAVDTEQRLRWTRSQLISHGQPPKLAGRSCLVAKLNCAPNCWKSKPTVRQRLTRAGNLLSACTRTRRERSAGTTINSDSPTWTPRPLAKNGKRLAAETAELVGGLECDEASGGPNVSVRHRHLRGNALLIGVRIGIRSRANTRRDTNI